MTNITEEQELTDISLAQKVVIGIVLSFVIFLSIFGNVLVCLAVYTDRNLRKIGNLFVVSLAIADLFVACVVMTFALVNDLLGYWPFGSDYCDIWIAFDVMCSTASIVNLCAISLDRYIHIKDPLRYGRWMTKRIVTLSIAGIWVLSALVSFLPISLKLHKPPDKHDSPQQQKGAGGESDHLQCALELSRIYAVVSSCISFFLPCCVMLAIYSRLYLYAKRHVESIKALVRPVTLGSLEGDTTRPKKVAAPCHVSESKAATTVGIIVGTFLTCWVPFFCVNIAAAFCQDCIPEVVFKTLTWFGYTNSSFNPIIYSIFNQQFRDAFRRILTSRCRPCPEYCCCCCFRDPIGVPFSSSSQPACSCTCSSTSCSTFCCCCCSLLRPSASRPGPSSAVVGVGVKGQAVSRHVEGSRHNHQNGSSTALTEYTVLETATPKFSHDRSRASSGERCLILEQISAI